MIIFINIELAKVPGYHSLTDGCKRPYEIGLWTDGTAAKLKFVQEEVLH